MIKVLIADDQALVRGSFRVLLHTAKTQSRGPGIGGDLLAIRAVILACYAVPGSCSPRRV